MYYSWQYCRFIYLFISHRHSSSLINRKAVLFWFNTVWSNVASHLKCYTMVIYLSLFKGCIKIGITCHMYEFFQRLWCWNLIISSWKFQIYNSNKSKGFEIIHWLLILPSVLGNFQLDIMLEFVIPEKQLKRKKINMYETLHIDCLISFIHTAMNGLYWWYRVMERRCIWDNLQCFLWLLHPEPWVASDSATLCYAPRHGRDMSLNEYCVQQKIASVLYIFM